MGPRSKPEKDESDLSREKPPNTFDLNGTPVDFVSQYTYLGVTITKNGHVNAAGVDLGSKIPGSSICL